MHGGADTQKPRWGGLILALLAATLLTLAAFMPKLYSQTIQLQHNRPIDSWVGAALIACAVLILVGAVLGLRRRRWGWLDCAAGAAALGLMIYASSGSRLIVLKGVPGVQGDVHAVPGIGLLVAGLGALVAIGAGLLISLARSRRPSLGRPPRIANFPPN
jgi:hypothetical protein